MIPVLRDNVIFDVSFTQYCVERKTTAVMYGDFPGGRFKNMYELLNLRALKFSHVNKIHIFQCMGKIFCVEFQRYPLKFHTKYLTHTILRALRFKSSNAFLKRPPGPCFQRNYHILLFYSIKFRLLQYLRQSVVHFEILQQIKHYDAHALHRRVYARFEFDPLPPLTVRAPGERG